MDSIGDSVRDSCRDSRTCSEWDLRLEPRGDFQPDSPVESQFGSKGDLRHLLQSELQKDSQRESQGDSDGAYQRKSRRMPTRYGGLMMPRSVMKPVMRRDEVTSKAGLKTGTPLGAARHAANPRTSSPSLSSTTICRPVGVARSKVDVGATT
jgi:hypothetical protein